jgi:hypothetical protein
MHSTKESVVAFLAHVSTLKLSSHLTWKKETLTKVLASFLAQDKTMSSLLFTIIDIQSMDLINTMDSPKVNKDLTFDSLTI